jgi:putative transposase
LSHNQHRLIRKFAQQELITSGAQENLLAAKQRLHDHWMDATTTRKRADALKAGRYADFTSSRVVEPQPVSVATKPVPDAAPKLQLPLAVPPEIKEIPNFDSFSF